MKRIVKLTENDLTRIVRRVIKEQQMDGPQNNRKNRDEMSQTDDVVVFLDGASEETVNNALSNLTGNERFIAILNSEFADFSGVDLCSFSELSTVNLKGTQNNFEEQGYDCAELLIKGMYVFNDF
jgi:hypothetical protein